MNIADMTVNLRILVGGKNVAGWRLRVLGIVARLLRVPLDVQA